MKKIYIVILNYNGEKDTIDCLNSLIKVTTKGFFLNTLVIDNSPQNPIKVNKEKYKKIKLEVIYNSENLGFTGGNNVGIEKALKNSADYVLILNNDTIVKMDFLIKLYEFAKENSDAGIIAPKIYFAKNHEFHKDRYKEDEKGRVFWYAGGIIDWRNILGRHIGVDEVDRGQHEDTVKTDFASGCCMLISKEVLGKVGSFDDKYFLYYEDSDLSERVKKANFNIYYIPKAVIWHKNAGSTGGPGSDLQDYYITRNRMLFGFRYAPVRSRIALLREGLKLMLVGRLMQKKGAKDFFLRRFGKSKYI